MNFEEHNVKRLYYLNQTIEMYTLKTDVEGLKVSKESDTRNLC